MSKKVLGKGLEALIPQELKESVDSARVIQIPVGDISPNPHQPRKQFDDTKIKSLSQSIRSDGILQPVVVRRRGDHFELIMGERRLQAARLAGVPTVPAVLRGAEDVDALRLALVENLQRENLNPIEVAQALRALIDTFGLSQGDLAKVLGKDRSSIANTLRLLGLPEEIRELLRSERITEGHARALLALPTKAEQMALVERILKDSLSVRQVESETTPRKRTAKDTSTKEKPAHISFLEKAMSQHLATRVHIDEKRGGKGKITIEFYSHDDFERLTSLMQIPLPR